MFSIASVGRTSGHLLNVLHQLGLSMDCSIECTAKGEYDVRAEMPSHLLRTEHLQVRIAIVSDQITNAFEGTFGTGN